MPEVRPPTKAPIITAITSTSGMKTLDSCPRRAGIRRRKNCDADQPDRGADDSHADLGSNQPGHGTGSSTRPSGTNRTPDPGSVRK